MAPSDRPLRPIYATPTEAAAAERFEEFAATWGERYPGIGWLWRSAWPEFVPFVAFPVEVRRVIFSGSPDFSGCDGGGVGPSWGGRRRAGP